MKNGLNGAQLKGIAVIAMVCDHMVPLINYSESQILWYLAVTMNTIGRITMPIMCFFVAQGYYHTRNVKAYLLRMAVFALISQLPFYFNHITTMPCGFWDFIKGNVYGTNVIVTLFMGLLALCIAKCEKLVPMIRIILCAGCIYLTKHSDWRLFGVMWVLAFGLFYGDFKKQAAAFVIIALVRTLRMENAFSMVIQFAVVLALPLLVMYNGEKGRQSKYGFYIFYPAHLALLAIVKHFV